MKGGENVSIKWIGKSHVVKIESEYDNMIFDKHTKVDQTMIKWSQAWIKKKMSGFNA